MNEQKLFFALFGQTIVETFRQEIRKFRLLSLALQLLIQQEVIGIGIVDALNNGLHD